MKTSNLKLAIAALTAATFFATMPTMKLLANNTNPVVATQATQPTITIKVLGLQDEFVILEIDLNQSADQNSRLMINDDKGDGMYEESVSSKTFSRKIKVAPSEISKIQVVFSTPSVDVKKFYSINVSLVSKVDVTEVAKSN